MIPTPTPLPSAQLDPFEAAGGTKPRGSRSAFQRMRGSSIVSLAAAIWAGLVIIVAAAPNVFAPENPTVFHIGRVLQPPGVDAVLGTDQYGRDIWVLLVHGSTVAVMIGVVATVIAVVIGGLLGLIGGYAGGVTDMLIGRLIDMMMCFPGVLLALVIVAALGPTTLNLMIAVGVGGVPAFARVMRGQVLAVRSRLFIEAARSNGFRQLRILFRHVLPNSLEAMVVLGTISVGSAIIAAASLSYLGLGPKTAVPDWGQLLAAGQPYLAGAWWISTYPGVVLTLTVIAISLLGDWIRDRMNLD